MKQAKCIAVRVGDHSGSPARDIAPDSTPITIFEDGAVWFVLDLPTTTIDAFRRVARRNGMPVSELLTEALLHPTVLEQFTRFTRRSGNQ